MRCKGTIIIMHYLADLKSFAPSCAQEAADKALVLELCASQAVTASQAGGALLWRTSKAFHFTASAFVVDRDAKSALFIYHRQFCAFSPAGGHADGASDLLAVAKKEAHEETGLRALSPLCPGMVSFDILPVFGHVKNGAHVSAHLHLNATYLFAADSGAPLSPSARETGGAKWFLLSEIGSVSSEAHMQAVYRKVIKRLFALGA